MVPRYTQKNQVHHVIGEVLKLEPFHLSPGCNSPGSPQVSRMVLASGCVWGIIGEILVSHRVCSRSCWLNSFATVTHFFALVVFCQEVALVSSFEVRFETKPA